MGIPSQLESWKGQEKHCLACPLHLSCTPSLLWSEALFALRSVSFSPLSHGIKSLKAEVQHLKVQYRLGPPLCWKGQLPLPAPYISSHRPDVAASPRPDCSGYRLTLLGTQASVCKCVCVCWGWGGESCSLVQAARQLFLRTHITGGQIPYCEGRERVI
jgi:hypothetical protein